MTDGRKDVGRSRRKPPSDKAPPVIHDLVALQNDAGMTDTLLNRLAGYDASVLRKFRQGRMPPLRALMEYAQVFGYEVRLVKKNTPGY